MHVGQPIITKWPYLHSREERTEVQCTSSFRDMLLLAGCAAAHVAVCQRKRLGTQPTEQHPSPTVPPLIQKYCCVLCNSQQGFQGAHLWVQLIHNSPALVTLATGRRGC